MFGNAPLPYRSPDSYVVGTPDYYRWLNEGIDNWTGSAEFPAYGGSGGGGGGNGSFPVIDLPIINAPVSGGSPIISTPKVDKLDETIKTITATSTKTESAMPLTNVTPTKGIKEILEDNPLIALVGIGVIGYLILK